MFNIECQEKSTALFNRFRLLMRKRKKVKFRMLMVRDRRRRRRRRRKRYDKHYTHAKMKDPIVNGENAVRFSPKRFLLLLCQCRHCFESGN